MRLPNGVRRLFRLPITRTGMLRDADEELQFHLAMRVAEFRALGLSETEAPRQVCGFALQRKEQRLWTSETKKWRENAF